jgi:hypothetical protein
LEKKRWNDLSAGTNKRQENFILSQGHDQSLPWQTEKKENRKTIKREIQTKEQYVKRKIPDRKQKKTIRKTNK